MLEPTAVLLPYHEQVDVMVAAPRQQVFDFIDDPKHLAGHMSKPSWRMAGSTMDLTTDAHGGRRTGSRMRLAGRMLGMRLVVETVVTERDPPVRKAWETSREPKLIVIGPYRMSATIDRMPAQSRVALRIDYALPGTRRDAVTSWLARRYARWCVRRMASEVAAAFAFGTGARAPRITAQNAAPRVATPCRMRRTRSSPDR